MNQAPAIPAVSVVVPVFNEEENVSILQSELQSGPDETPQATALQDSRPC